MRIPGLVHAMRLCLFVLPLLGAAGAPVGASEDSRLYLSWHAPYGLPGATSDLTIACGDTLAEDTLYLCCDPGTDSKTFNGFSAVLYFRAALGDTLGPYWHFGQGMKGLRRIRALFDADSSAGLAAPWPSGGFGAINYDSSPGAGHLQMVFAVPPSLTGSVRYGQRYCLARLLFRRPPSAISGCGQPVCIEWTKAALAFAYGYEPEVSVGDRYASLNSPDGAVCKTYRGRAVPPVWKPKDGSLPR